MTNCTWCRNTIFSFCWRNFPGSYGHSIRRAALALQVAEGDYHPMHILYCCVYADGFDDGNGVGALFGGEKLIAIVLKVMALTMETLLMMFVVLACLKQIRVEVTSILNISHSAADP